MIHTRKKYLLLIADDLPDNLQAITNILQSRHPQNYEFITVPNGQILVEIALKKIPDLIITDWDMPVMNGVEAILELKKNEDTRHIPVIVCTGVMLKTEDLYQALESGAVDFVRKPVEALELEARVNSMLRLSDSYHQIQSNFQELKESNELKDRLLSVISHDVRGPINTLKGMFNLLEDDQLSMEEVKMIINQINLQAGQVSDFLENLLYWAKNQLLNSPPNRTFFLLSKNIQSTLDLLYSSAQKKGIEFTCNYLDEKVYCDEEMIRIVFRNLISNAVKYCRKGDQIQIRMEVDYANKILITHVADTGIGMPKDRVENLFKNRIISQKGTGDELGTGLGLMLVQQYVENNQGKIFVDSVENKGSDFIVQLPLQ